VGMSSYNKICNSCRNYNCICEHYRKNKIPAGRVCTGCGHACLNLRMYNTDCLGYKDGIDKSRQKKFLEKNYTDYDYNPGRC